MVRKELLAKVDGFSERPDLITVEDYDLWMKLSLATRQFSFISSALGEFRQHGESASSAVDRHLKAELTVIADHAALESQTLLNTIRLRQRRAVAISDLEGRSCVLMLTALRYVVYFDHFSSPR